MKTEQVPGEEPCSPHPEAAHIARVAHNLMSEGAGTRQEPNPSGAAEERRESC